MLVQNNYHILTLLLWRLAILLLLAPLVACRGEHDGSRQALTGSASYVFFEQKVLPLLETRCGATCHGVDVNTYDAFISEGGNAGHFHFPIDRATGLIPRTPQAIKTAFDAATGGSSPRIDYGAAAHFSPLLRHPLAEEYGGLPHHGVEVFSTTEDEGYRTLKEWVAKEIARKPQPQQKLSPQVSFFQDQVLGVLARNGCFLANCHGPAAFNDLKLQPPLPVTAGENFLRGFSPAMVAANRKALLGNVTRFANLGGDPRRSRLIVKNLPIAEGGVHQRGGNNQFFESFADKDVQILLAWLSLERKALAEHLTSESKPIPAAELGQLKGIAFICGPRHAPRRFFDLDSFWPGSDIYLLPMDANGKEGKPVNLTESLHAGYAVEIQGFDIRYDGRAIAFSMRQNAQSGFRLYELTLKDDQSGISSWRQLSFAPERQASGDLIHHIDPLYTPGPADPESLALDNVAIAYASNESGSYAQAQPWGLIGEADSGAGVMLNDRERTERPHSFDGRHISFVAGPNQGASRLIRAQLSLAGGGSQLVLDRPLAAPIDRRTVYVIEQTKPEVAPAYDIWRFVPAAGDTQTAYRASARRMTWTNAQERRPTMRTSGEVMFTSVRNIGYQAGRPVYNGAIFRVQAGGFDYHIHGGNRSRYPLFADSRESAEGLEVRMALDPRNYWGGSVMLADHGLGINVEPENPQDGLAFSYQEKTETAFASPPRYLPPLVPLLPETGEPGSSHGGLTHTGISPGGAFRDPYPLPDGTLLVSHVSGSIDHLDPNADPDWDVYRVRFEGSPQSEDGRAAGKLRLERIAGASSELADTMPRPLMVRLKELPAAHQKFLPELEEKKLRDEYGVKRAPADTPAVIESYDYPLLQSFLTDFTPVGERDLTKSDRLFRYVRILAEVPPTKADLTPLADGSNPFATRLSSGIHTRKQIVAEIPLEPDGSFYAQVPPNTPLIIQGLDAQRRAVHSMNRWFYLQPGERLTLSIPRRLFSRACSGCHGSLTGQSLDALGPIDAVTAASKVVANWDPVTGKRRKPYGQSGAVEYQEIDFVRDVQPLLDRNCVACHGGALPAANLSLEGNATQHYNRAYESLHKLRDPASGNFADKRYVDEREALSSKSYLIAKLLGENFPGIQQPQNNYGKPHPDKAPLTEQELLVLIRWIDLGATFRGGSQ